MDTMMVNGHPYPYLDVQPQAYRFRVLNACNDRNINLSLFVADNGGGGRRAVAIASHLPSPAKPLPALPDFPAARTIPRLPMFTSMAAAAPVRLRSLP